MVYSRNLTKCDLEFYSISRTIFFEPFANIHKKGMVLIVEIFCPL